MDNKQILEILEAVIQKAIDNGWVRPRYLPNVSVDNLAYDALDFGVPYTNTIIFDHSFAKALWGEETEMLVDPLTGIKIGWGPAWKEKLMEMVISSDPIAYLKEHAL